jgi:DUF4097 and DUF4098 domain-containing protein YvlB
MNAHVRLAPRFVAAGALAVLLVASANAQTRRDEKHFGVEGKPVVVVQNPSGHVQIKAWDKHEVMVVGEHTDSIAVGTEQVGNRIEVAAQMTRPNASPADVKTNFEITVPTETELRIRTDSGDVTVDSVHGDMSFDTVAADLALQDVEGYVVIKSIGGSLVCTRCAGSLDATSISGNFQMVQPSMDNVQVQTSSGNILFDGSFLPRGIYVLKNYSGTIEVRFSNTDSFDVRAASLYGNVVNEAPVVPDRHQMPAPRNTMAKSLFGTVNDGHAKVELSSFSGTIKILKR